MPFIDFLVKTLSKKANSKNCQPMLLRLANSRKIQPKENMKSHVNDFDKRNKIGVNSSLAKSAWEL